MVYAFLLIAMWLPFIIADTFSWFIEHDGKIFIRGRTTTGEKKVLKHGKVYLKCWHKFFVHRVNFPSHFKLLGPINSDGVNAGFGTDGIFEGVVKKIQPQTFRYSISEL